MLSRLPVGARNRPVPNCTGRPSPLRRRFSSRSKGSKRPIQLLRLSAAHPAHTDVPFLRVVGVDGVEEVAVGRRAFQVRRVVGQIRPAPPTRTAAGAPMRGARGERCLPDALFQLFIVHSRPPSQPRFSLGCRLSPGAARHPGESRDGSAGRPGSRSVTRRAAPTGTAAAWRPGASRALRPGRTPCTWPGSGTRRRGACPSPGGRRTDRRSS